MLTGDKKNGELTRRGVLNEESMKSKHEQALVGTFVIVAVALLIGTVWRSPAHSAGAASPPHLFQVGGRTGAGRDGSLRRMKAGKVKANHVDPKDSTRIEIDFSVKDGIPVKTNSVAKISSLGALADNYVESGNGDEGCAAGSLGQRVACQRIVDRDLRPGREMIGGLAPVAQKVLDNLTTG